MNTTANKRRICIVTTTRADWGLLSPLAKILKEYPSVNIQVVASNMHLNPKYGMTIDEIIKDGIKVDAKVEMNPKGDSSLDTAIATSKCLSGIAKAFERLKPDMIVILGDRYEMLAVATAATIMRIPIAHIAGGEISEGAFDDNIRHALTKLSTLHFTATDAYRNRVIAMGENPKRVFNTGALGVYNIMHDPVMSKKELEDSIGIDLSPGSLLVTFHPATLDLVPTAERFQALLDALDGFSSSHIIFTYPNNDPDGVVIIEMINQYVRKHPGRAVAVPSLGRERYLSALHYVSAVVGNSSSGIVEVPSLGIPTVDIGIRQQGRIASSSVIHCEGTTEDIHRAISFALSPSGKRKALESDNPYSKADTARRIADIIVNADLDEIRLKPFVDPYPILNTPT